jgi:hypothetical protein
MIDSLSLTKPPKEISEIGCQRRRLADGYPGQWGKVNHMREFRMKRRIIFFFCMLGAILLSVTSLNSAQEKSSGIEPKADKILRQMGDYVGSLQQFTIRIENSIDTILESGMKLEIARGVDVFVRRPNRLRDH